MIDDREIKFISTDNGCLTISLSKENEEEVSLGLLTREISCSSQEDPEFITINKYRLKDILIELLLKINSI